MNDVVAPHPQEVVRSSVDVSQRGGHQRAGEGSLALLCSGVEAIEPRTDG